MVKLINEIGNVYGELTVMARAGSREYGEAKTKFVLWKCQCSCGNFLVTTGQLLRRGDTKACGHLRGVKSNTKRVPVAKKRRSSVIRMAKEGYSDAQIVQATGYTSATVKAYISWARHLNDMQIDYNHQRKGPLA